MTLPNDKVFSSQGVAHLDATTITCIFDRRGPSSVSNHSRRTILDPPTMIASGFAGPEGIALHPGGDKTFLYLLHPGSNRLNHIGLSLRQPDVNRYLEQQVQKLN